MDLIEKARAAGEHGEFVGKLSVPDFQCLMQNNVEEFNPVTSFLIGAAIWWELSDFNEWKDDFVEAYDLRPQGSVFLPFRLLANVVYSGSRAQGPSVPHCSSGLWQY
jgi:hypothetical protein